MLSPTRDVDSVLLFRLPPVPEPRNRHPKTAQEKEKEISEWLCSACRPCATLLSCHYYCCCVLPVAFGDTSFGHSSCPLPRSLVQLHDKKKYFKY